MKLRHLLLLPFLLLTACESKYPYPPQYVGPDQFSERAIGAPPAKYSAQYNAEIESIIEKQKHLTEADIADIRHEITITPELIVQPVLGEHYTRENYPALYTLLGHAGSDAWRISDTTRDYWGAPRPWYADRRIKRYTEIIYVPGYPSGHTTTFSTWAHVLSELMPEKREVLFKRAWQVGGNRVAGGAHFPYDVEGGKRLAALVYAQMRTSPAFIKEFNAAAIEIKRPRSQIPDARLTASPRPPGCCLASPPQR